MSADFRPASCEFGINERAGERDRTTGDPAGENQKRGVDLARDHVGIDENPGAHDPAHDEQRCVGEAEAFG